MMMPFCANHGELMTGPMLVCSHVSPAWMSWLPELLPQGDPVLMSPCMSLQSLGEIITKAGALAPLSAVTSPPGAGYGSTPSVLRSLHQLEYLVK